jgi:hypothetical protein
MRKAVSKMKQNQRITSRQLDGSKSLKSVGKSHTTISFLPKPRRILTQKP